MSTRYLCTSLANFGATVANALTGIGTVQSFDLDAIPDKITRAQLPCLILLPEVGGERGYRPLTFMGNAGQMVFDATHILFFEETANLSARKVLPGLLSQLDNYITAAQAQKFLDTQASPPNQVVITFTVNVNTGSYGGIEYHTLEFKHHYEIHL